MKPFVSGKKTDRLKQVHACSIWFDILYGRQTLKYQHAQSFCLLLPIGPRKRKKEKKRCCISGVSKSATHTLCVKITLKT
jgi:hypothetical protein